MRACLQAGLGHHHILTESAFHVDFVAQGSTCRPVGTRGVASEALTSANTQGMGRGTEVHLVLVCF